MVIAIKVIKVQKGPSKEDTKDLTSDDPKVEPDIPKTPEVCASISWSINEIQTIQ